MANNQKKNKSGVTKAAKSIKDGADTVFDSVQNAVEATESAAMNTVDKTADYLNEKLDDENK